MSRTARPAQPDTGPFYFRVKALLDYYLRHGQLVLFGGPQVAASVVTLLGGARCDQIYTTAAKRDALRAVSAHTLISQQPLPNEALDIVLSKYARKLRR